MTADPKNASTTHDVVDVPVSLNTRAMVEIGQCSLSARHTALTDVRLRILDNSLSEADTLKPNPLSVGYTHVEKDRIVLG